MTTETTPATAADLKTDLDAASDEKRMASALSKAGFRMPTEPGSNFFHYGMDSLKIALSILELEREFAFRYSGAGSLNDVFESKANLLTWIQEQVRK